MCVLTTQVDNINAHNIFIIGGLLVQTRRLGVVFGGLEQLAFNRKEKLDQKPGFMQIHLPIQFHQYPRYHEKVQRIVIDLIHRSNAQDY